jgi:hypothetical protein
MAEGVTRPCLVPTGDERLGHVLDDRAEALPHPPRHEPSVTISVPARLTRDLLLGGWWCQVTGELRDRETTVIPEAG